MNVERIWYERHPLALLLFPLSLLYALVTFIRRWCYRLGLFKVHRFSAPVIVVGNISLWGTGKTPLVIWLARHLRQLGYRPGIVSRGYGGEASSWPQKVSAESSPEMVGDEAVLIAQKTGCPVFVDPERPAAVEALLAQSDCNVVISDDCLQHYAMDRDLEIVVVDGKRGFGNGFLLPAGPLRESPRRLSSVDLVISNGTWRPEIPHMDLRETAVVAMNDADQERTLEAFSGERVDAIAGIGNPQRFFRMLEQRGVEVTPHAFPDHHPYKMNDLNFGSGLPLLMTEKDGVKCRQFPIKNCWVVQVAARPSKAFVDQLNLLLDKLDNG